MDVNDLTGFRIAGLVRLGSTGRPRRTVVLLNPIPFQRLVEDGKEHVNVLFTAATLDAAEVHASKLPIPEGQALEELFARLLAASTEEGCGH